MRRSGSQLRNLSNHAGRRGYGNPPSGNNAATHQYADEIQRRIDALGLGGHAAPMANPQQMGFQGNAFLNQAQNGPPMHNPGMPFANAPQAQVYQPPLPYPPAHAPTHPPMYADFPVPDYHAQGFSGAQAVASDNELHAMRDAIDALGEQLHSMQQHQSHVAQSMAQNSGMDEIQHSQLGAVANEVAELKRILANVASDQTAVQEIANLRQTLEATKAEISNSAGTPSIDTEAYARVVETSHGDLTRQIEEMRETFNKTSPASMDTDIIHKTLEASHDELKAQIEYLQNSISSSLTGSGLDKDRFEESHNEVLGQLSDIQAILLEKVKGAGEGEENPAAYENIEMRLEEITRAVVALSHSDPATDGIERIEARVSELSKNIGSASGDISIGDSDTAPLMERLDSITERLDQISGVMPTVASGGGSDENIIAIMYEISQKVDAIDAKVQASSSLEGAGALLEGQDVLETLQQLSASAEALNALPNTQALVQSIEKLEANVGHVANLLEAGSTEQNSTTVDEFSKKLTSIEEQIASNRDINIEMATQVAQETVERVMEQMQSSAMSETADAPALSVLTGLSEDIQKLHEASAQTNAQNIDAFSAIKDTLGSMVDRLSMLEEDAVNPSSQPQVAQAAVMTAPGEVPQMADAQTSPEPQYVPELQHDPEPEANIVPSIPSIDEFDEPVRLTGEEKEEKSTGQDMVAEYRALVAEQQTGEITGESDQVSIAQSLVDEAARAEEERKKLRASMSPSAALEELDGENPSLTDDREFHSSEMAIDTFDDELPALPIADAPEIVTPAPLPENDMSDISMEVDDRPLEPGSVGPDLAALVRKANETRKSRSKNGEGSSGTDFIAAARRAAQAAAEEASAAHEEIVNQEKDGDKGVLGSIPNLFSKRKKVISMAAVATLLAAMSVPFILGTFGSNENEQQAFSEQAPAEVELTELESANDGPANTPRVVKTTPADASNEEIVVASLGELQANDTPQSQPEPAIDTSSLVSGLDYVNDALKSSVAEGSAEAIYEVGRRHLEGIGVEKSAKIALEWYTRAAEMDFAPAQYIVANLNEKGVGIERNIPEAIRWYERAASNGNIISMHNLAVLHATPNAVNGTPDTDAAYKWFKKAAEYGVRDSLVNLGIFYTKGVGTEVDLIQAYKWFTLAAKAGDDDAGKKREVVTEYMRPDQLEVAKSQIEDWRPAEQNVAANSFTPNPEWQPVLASAPIGDSPEAIKKAQTLLGRLGYDAGPADGIMGAKTKQAIAEFQQRVGLGISGEISQELLTELEAVAI